MRRPSAACESVPTGFPGDQEAVLAAIDQVEMGGGPVATALCVLARLGRRVALVDVCGDDQAGIKVRTELAAHGVETSLIHPIKGARTAQAIVLVRTSDGARQIAFMPSDAGEPKWQPEIADVIAHSRLLHINGRHETVARKAVETALEAGVKVSFDGGAGRYRASLRDLVLASQVRIVSRDFAQQFSGSGVMPDMFHALAEGGPEVVVITDGAEGSYIWTPSMGVFEHQPAEKVAEVLDTTGCGDIYHGAFLHGWLNGWDAMRCAAFASELAAVNATSLGGRYICAQLAERLANG
jgi:sulfofructose kinase